MDKASLSRFILLIVAVINYVLNYFGYATISDEFVNDIIALISGGYFIYMAWKNNYISRKGQAQKETLEKAGLK